METGKSDSRSRGQLDREGHNVTVIDSNQAVLDKTSNLLDVVGIYGNGATPQTLKEAGADHADLVIAATSKDEINILSCLLAKKMGARHTIARIRTPEYVDSLNYVKEELGLSLDINPELAAAREIRRSLRFTSEIHTSSLAKARLELAEIKVFDHSPLAGKTIMEISKAYKQSVLFCLIERDDDLIIPSGNTIVRANDKLVLTGRTKQLQSFFNELKILKNDPIKEVMIIGGGRITYYLTPMLSELGIAVTIIEKDAEKCLKLVESFPYATIIHGDGTDHELLMSENLEKMDGFVALTDNDEENVMVSMFAAAKGVSHVIPKVNRVELGFIFEKLGLRNAITVDGKIVNKETVDQIMAFFGAWMIIIAAATLIVALDNFDFTTTQTSVYTCLGNVGPGLGLCGPSGSFAMLSGFPRSCFRSACCLDVWKFIRSSFFCFLCSIVSAGRWNAVARIHYEKGLRWQVLLFHRQMI